MLLDSNRRELFSNNFNKENLQIINVTGPASVASGPAPVSSKPAVQTFPKLFCGDGNTQVGTSCYPDFLVNKK
jgi:hypothetical protein